MTSLPQSVNIIFNYLERAGQEAYVVGGCVRDFLLEKTPKDWDICTDALPQRVMEIFSDFTVVPTGLKHGTVTLMMENIPYEITTYRKEKAYEDGRRPSQVSFVQNIKMDLSRRDFTINAIAFHPKKGFVDPFDGASDIKAKIIQTVGDPFERFSEDYLRMLRAVRFSAVLDFRIEAHTRQAISLLEKNIEYISKERIRDELLKIFSCNNTKKGIRILQSTGLLRRILPEVSDCIGLKQNNPHHNKDVYEHTLEVMEYLEKSDWKVKLAALLHDIGKADTKSIDEKGIDHFYAHEQSSEEKSRAILHRLKFSNEEIQTILLLIKNHGYIPELKRSAVKRFINKVGKNHVFMLLELQKADKKAHVNRLEYDDTLSYLEETIKDILSCQEPLTMKDLKIDGRDILAEGYGPGKEIGEIKQRLLKHVIEHPHDNEKNKLLFLLKEIKSL